MSLEGATLIMSGGSRGIGEAIAIRAARDGANIALLARTSDPDPTLPGTIHTAATAIEAAGGKALPLVGDIRDDAFVLDAVAHTVEAFGGIDIVVNNASIIDLSPTETISMESYDLMASVNARGTFLLSKACIPHLKKSANGHILTLSPPIRLKPQRFKTSTAYTMAKFGGSLVTMALSEELREDEIAVNSLWPRTVIDTASVRGVVGDTLAPHSRTPSIVADAAHAILTRPSREITGQFLIDDDVLAEAGITDYSVYLNGNHETDLALDFWVEPKGPHNPAVSLH